MLEIWSISNIQKQEKGSSNMNKKVRKVNKY